MSEEKLERCECGRDSLVERDNIRPGFYFVRCSLEDPTGRILCFIGPIARNRRTAVRIWNRVMEKARKKK